MQLNTAVILVLTLAVLSVSSKSQICNEGERKPMIGKCNSFFECYNQNWTVKQCFKSNSFDSETNTCRPRWLLNCQDAPRTCSKPGEYIEVPGDCQSYYVCLENGNLRKESCPKFHRFDINSNKCQWWVKVDCSKHKECSTNIKFPLENNNRGYKSCEGGKFVIRKCDSGMEFDAEANRCLDSTIQLLDSDSGICKNGTRKVIAGRCNKYYECDGGKYQEKKCSWIQRFDPKTLVCDYIWNVDCSLGTECKDGQNIPAGKCSNYYRCENGYWLRKSCGNEIGIQLQFDTVSKQCMLYGATCFEGECVVDGLKEEFPGDCSKYKVCHKRQLYEKSCGFLEKFDSKKRECKLIDVECSSTQNEPICKNGLRTSLDDSCYTFKECLEGHFVTKYCFFPFFRFDRKTMSCRFLASCNKSCREGETKPVDEKCDQYYACKGGKYLLKNCSNGFHYDAVTSKCVQHDKATCISSIVTKTRQKRNLQCYYPIKITDPLDCSQYLECSEGEWKTVKCGYFRRFDPSTGFCEWSWSLTCFTPAIPTRRPFLLSPTLPTRNIPPMNVPETDLSIKTSDTKNFPLSGKNTPQQSTSAASFRTTSTSCLPGSTKPVNESCTKFLVCNKTGQWVPKSCTTWCKNFNPNTSKCVWKWQYPCGKGSECKDGPLKADPNNCKQYYQCISGQYVLKSCSFMHKFNKNTLTCEFSLWPWC